MNVQAHEVTIRDFGWPTVHWGELEEAVEMCGPRVRDEFDILKRWYDAGDRRAEHHFDRLMAMIRVDAKRSRTVRYLRLAASGGEGW